MEKDDQAWLKWFRRYERDPDDRAELMIGDERLPSIHHDHRVFDIKNAKGAVQKDCLIRECYETHEWRGDPSRLVERVSLEAVTSEGWTIKIDDQTLLRRSTGSVQKEREARQTEEMQAAATRKKELEAELAQVNQKLGNT